MAPPLKPRALQPGDSIRILSLSSPVHEDRLQRGLDELTHLGYRSELDRDAVLARDGFFAGSHAHRLQALQQALAELETSAIFFSRGGYGASYLLDCLNTLSLTSPKMLCGYSDVTSLQLFLWRKFRLVTIYGPMVASGFDHGADAADGYDSHSFLSAVTQSHSGWSIDLAGESIVAGTADGVLLGGCLTLVETALATPWELDTAGAILVLEDRGMKPWQVDRAFLHLKQAGKFRGVQAIVLGDFPECEPPAGSESVRDVARRVLTPLGIPLVWGAAVGHTQRPKRTLPLGVQARLLAAESPKLEILEATCAS
jgi:muramoyltetrapeptide carboxypeptidase